MSIIGYSKNKNICISYDELRLQTAVGYADQIKINYSLNDSIDRSVCKALYKEKLFTSYTSESKSSANKRMGCKARLFGDFSIRPEDECRHMCILSHLADVEKLFINNIVTVFRNRAKTEWSFNGVRRGSLRLYPSNGAIHALRPKMILQHCVVDYFPYLDEVECINRTKSDLSRFRLEVVIEFSRVLEKYRDVGSLAAIYIEFGHLLAVINEFVRFPVASVGFVDGSKFFVEFFVPYQEDI